LHDPTCQACFYAEGENIYDVGKGEFRYYQDIDWLYEAASSAAAYNVADGRL